MMAVFFVMFQAVFAWATPFADALDAGAGWLHDTVKGAMPPACCATS